MSSPIEPSVDLDNVESKPSSALLRFAIPAVIALLAWFAGASLTGEQRVIATIFAFTVSLWIAETLPLAMTALLSTTLLVLAGGIDEKKAFAAYGDPIILLFVGSFLLAKAMEVTSLNQRAAWWLLKQRWASASPGRLLMATAIIGSVISLFVSNTATTAMMLPVAIVIVAAMSAEKTRFSTAMMLMLTWSTSVAVGVPVGTPPNLIGIGLLETATGVKISFLQWMAFGMPISIIMVIVAWTLLRVADVKPGIDTSEAAKAAQDNFRAMPAFKPSEKVVLLAFGVALTLWILPDLMAALFEVSTGAVPDVVKWMQKRITATVAALIGASLLFIIPVADRPAKRALSWREGTTIDWGVMMLFGGGIALGQAMFSSGLAEVLGKWAANASGADSLWTITALAIGASIVLSELASNTAAATTLVPVAIGLAQGAGVSPIPPALGAAIGASFGFMLPVSTAPNAIVYSSGQVSMKQMALRGGIIDVLGFATIWVCLRLILPLLGLT